MMLLCTWIRHSSDSITALVGSDGKIKIVVVEGGIHQSQLNQSLE